MRKFMKKLLSILLIAVMLSGTCMLGGCKSEEERHIARITRRVEKHYMTKHTDLTGFEVFPLYNEKDEITQYYLVEFEPYGFIFVSVAKGVMQSCVGFGPSHYTASAEYHNLSEDWQRYTLLPPIDMGNGEYYDGLISTRFKYETDENGEYIYYNRSPYKVAGIENEKLYFLIIRQGNEETEIPAAKRGDKYLNLMSMELFEYKDEFEGGELPCYFGNHFIGKPIFDL